MNPHTPTQKDLKEKMRNFEEKLRSLQTFVRVSEKFLKRGADKDASEWAKIAQASIKSIVDEYPFSRPLIMPSVKKVASLFESLKPVKTEEVHPDAFLDVADLLINRAAEIMPVDEEEAKGLLKLAHSLLTDARDEVQSYARSVMVGVPMTVRENEEIEAGKLKTQALYDRMTATGLKLLEVSGRSQSILDEPLEGIRSAARKKASRLPRMIIETMVVRKTAARVRALFPQVEHLYLVGSRLRHRYARDLEFVAVIEDERNLPGRSLVNIFGRPADKEIAKMSPAKIEELPIKVDLFFALPEELEATILEFGLGLDNIRWKKKAAAKGYKLTRYGLFKGSKLVARDMEKIAALIGMPLKPHLVFSLKNPL